MTPLFKHMATLTKDVDNISILHGSKPMSHSNHGPPLCRALKGCLDEPLALRVERAGGFVEEEDLGVADEGAGDGDALLLATREGDTAGADVGVVAFGEGGDEVVDRSVAAGGV